MASNRFNFMNFVKEQANNKKIEENKTTPTEQKTVGTEPAKTKSSLEKSIEAGITGTAITLLQTPFTNAGNITSAIACDKNLSTPNAMKVIYRGRLYGTDKTFFNFTKGMSAQYAKEWPRLYLIKIPGLYYLNPWLDKQKNLTQNIRNLTFAGITAFGEMCVNYFDVLRMRRQLGLPPIQTLAQAADGAALNGGRQFVTWYGFATGTSLSQKFLKDHTSIDPHSFRAILATAPAISAIFTIPSYLMFERQKNVIQANHSFYSTIPFGKKYYTAFTSMTWKQWLNGLTPKWAGNTFLTIGALTMSGIGKGTLKLPNMHFFNRTSDNNNNNSSKRENTTKTERVYKPFR